MGAETTSAATADPGETEPNAGLPEPVARFRERARRELIPGGYSPVRHVLGTVLIPLTVISVFISMLHDVTPAQWLVVPVALVVAHCSEYFGHRYPMHHVYPGLRRVFQRHAGQHHRYYTATAMSWEGPRDLYLVLFAPVLQLFFFGAIGAPLCLLVLLLAGANAALLFGSSITAYYLCYEALHTYYHMPERAWLEALPVLPALRRHHRLHHDPAMMQRWNYNLTLPVLDVLLGTRHRG